MKTGKYKPKFGAQIGEFISSCSLKTRKTFLDPYTNRYKYVLEIEKETFQKAQSIKKYLSILYLVHSQIASDGI